MQLIYRNVWLIMRLTTLFILLAMVTASASSNAQSVSFSGRNVTLKAVFDAVKAQTGYTFFYRSQDLKGAKPVSLDLKDTPLPAFLDRVFERQHLGYNIQGKTVFVTKNPAASMAPAPSVRISANNEAALVLAYPEVRGRVVDSLGNPLQGASVRVLNAEGKRTTLQTKTDSDGYFELKNVPEGYQLELSYIGHVATTIMVAADVGIVVLKAVPSELEEVEVMVNTGYQQLPKERATGSFVLLNQEQIESRTDDNIMDRLVGNLPGLQKDTRTDSRYRYLYNIRGQSTINLASSEPLIVVDNFPYEGDIDLLNPNDIESVTLLKDAAATSIWGARAGNGVIVITTKRAKLRGDREPAISFNTNFSTSEKPDLYYNNDGMSVSEFIDNEIFLFNQGAYNGDFTGLAARQRVTSPVVDLLEEHRRGLIDDATLRSEMDALRNIDYREEYKKYFLQTPYRQTNNLSISGGTDKANYIISGGFQQSRSAVLNANDGKRYQVRSATTLKPTDKLNIMLNALYSRNEVKRAGVHYPLSAAAGGKMGLYPYARLVGDGGEALAVPNKYNKRFLDTVNTANLLDWTYRPLDEIDGRIQNSNTTNLNIDLRTSYNLTNSISAELAYGYQFQGSSTADLSRLESFDVRDLINRYTQINGNVVNHNLPMGGIMSMSNDNINANNLRGRINYSQTINGVHAVHAFVGSDITDVKGTTGSYRMYGYDEETRRFSFVDYITRHPIYGNLSGNTSIEQWGSDNASSKRMVSFYANGSYTYDEKYILSFSARRDASNLLGVKTNERWKPLWSSGIAWNLSKESFFNTDFIDVLKLRATYGHSGNIVAGNSYYPAMVVRNAAALTNLPYGYITSYPDANRKWEDLRMINMGLDFSVLNRRITGSIEYFDKKATDLIAADRVDPTTSQNTAYKNVGVMIGNGVDIILNSANLNGKFRWTSNFSLSYVKDRIKKYTGNIGSASSIISGSHNPGSSTLLEGYPFYPVFSYRSAGLDPENGDPRGYDKDGNISKDYINLLNESLDNLVFHGVGMAPYHGFLRNNFMYKNFELSVNMVFKMGFYFKEPGISEQSIYTNWQLPDETYKRRWQKPGDELTTYVPSVLYPVQSNRSNFGNATSAFIHKGDFIRLQDIRLAYNLSLRGGHHPIRFQVYATASQPGNLWQANKIGRDPDHVDSKALSSYSLGLNVNL